MFQSSRGRDPHSFWAQTVQVLADFSEQYGRSRSSATEEPYAEDWEAQGEKLEEPESREKETS